MHWSPACGAPDLVSGDPVTISPQPDRSPHASAHIGHRDERAWDQRRPGSFDVTIDTTSLTSWIRRTRAIPAYTGSITSPATASLTTAPIGPDQSTAESSSQRTPRPTPAPTTAAITMATSG